MVPVLPALEPPPVAMVASQPQDVERMRKQLDRLEGRLDRLEERFDTLEQLVHKFKQEGTEHVRQVCEHFGSRLDPLERPKKKRTTKVKTNNPSSSVRHPSDIYRDIYRVSTGYPVDFVHNSQDCL